MKYSSLPLNPFDEIRFEEKEVRHHRCLDIRIYTALKEGEEKIPTGKGLLVPLDKLPDLSEALRIVDNRQKHWVS